jgi:hypothetical protein
MHLPLRGLLVGRLVGPRLALGFAVCGPLSVAACSLEPDAPATYRASPLGNGRRLAEVQDPRGPAYAPNTTVNLTSLAVVWTDTFDETKDGKSLGTVFVQDVASTAPYSAISVFQPSYVPSDLRLLPGDVLDFTGPYQEVTAIGSAHFPAGQTLPQLAKPVGTFRYEYQAPPAKPIALADLNDYATGRQWEGMLVTVQDVYVVAGSTNGGRVTYTLVPNPDAGSNVDTVAISNEEYDLTATDFAPGTHFQSVTGIVTWFFSFHIAPRSPSDLVQ